MTSGSAPQPPSHPKNEAEYARKLALAILSTLESKGFLSKVDVDTILAVAHRAVLQAESAASTETAEVAAPGDTAEQPEPPTAHRSESAGAGAKAGENSVLTAPVEVKRPLGPAVLGTRWVKPEAPAPAGRSETEDLVYEAGAVKVVGQRGTEAAAPKRPLAPAIVTAGKAGGAEPEAAAPLVTGEAEASKREGEGDRQVPVKESADVPASPAGQDVPPGETKVDEKKGNLPVVIDFEMD